MDSLTQLNRAMEYIETHIDDDLALADVSTVTAYEPSGKRQLHQMFQQKKRPNRITQLSLYK